MKSAGKSALSERLRAVFDAQHQRMFRAAFRVTGNLADAEDVLQTVFLRLLQREGWSELPAEEIGHYLHRAAINAALDQLRARGRRKVIPLDALRAAPAEDRGGSAGLEDAVLRARLRRGIGELSPRAAEIFSLRYLEGFGNQEIADMVGASDSAVGVSLHRSRERLRKMLAESTTGEEE